MVLERRRLLVSELSPLNCKPRTFSPKFKTRSMKSPVSHKTSLLSYYRNIETAANGYQTNIDLTEVTIDSLCAWRLACISFLLIELRTRFEASWKRFAVNQIRWPSSHKMRPARLTEIYFPVENPPSSSKVKYKLDVSSSTTMQSTLGLLLKLYTRKRRRG